MWSVWSGKWGVLVDLFDADLDQLRIRVEQLDQWARARETGEPESEHLCREVFPDGFDPERDWDNYHRVRNEWDRRAAEEFDLGQ